MSEKIIHSGRRSSLCIRVECRILAPPGKEVHGLNLGARGGGGLNHLNPEALGKELS